MPPRRRPLLAAGVALALLTGLAACSDDAERQEGDPVTDAEADLLAGLLAGNAQEGGADFVVTAPFGEDSLLTLTGEVDYADAVGRAQAVTSSGDTDEVVRTVFFTADQLWFGDVPGLTEALEAAALPPAEYVRRALTPVDGGPPSPPLTDVLVRLVLNLSAAEDDDPGAFRAGDYTWQGQRSIDGRLSTVFASPAGWQVAVDGSTDLLAQYVTVLPGSDSPVTVSLSDHGPREIAPPADEETVDGAAHPELLAAIGL